MWKEGGRCEIHAGDSDQCSTSVPHIYPGAPDQVDSAAVTTNGNLTMVNEYLADQSTSGAADSTDTSAADSSTDNNSDDNTDSSDAGTGESDGSEEQ